MFKLIFLLRLMCNNSSIQWFYVAQKGSFFSKSKQNTCPHTHDHTGQLRAVNPVTVAL